VCLQTGFYLENLISTVVHTAGEAVALYRAAAARAAIAPHALNAASSRSHVVVELTVASTAAAASAAAAPTGAVAAGGGNVADAAPQVARDGDCAQERRAVLQLADLAGCERRRQTRHAAGSAGAAEGGAINASLAVLRRVIAALAADAAAAQQCTLSASSGEAPVDTAACRGGGAAPPQRPPWRDSKLTSLLREGLGGAARSVLIACVNADDAFIEDSVSTLQYAALVRRARLHHVDRAVLASVVSTHIPHCCS
jgi:Kinesin motor domain